MAKHKVAPLNTSFMLGSILGLIFSFLYVYSKSKSFGFAFGIVFFVMFIASIISMLKADPEELLYVDSNFYKDDKLYKELLDNVKAVKNNKQRKVKKKKIKKS